MKTKTLYIADDHEIVSQGIKEYLNGTFASIKTFKNGKELCEAIKYELPHFLILDLNMPEVNGLEILEFIQKKELSIKTIILTMYNETSLIEKCKRLGACAYLLKTSSNEDLMEVFESTEFVYGKGVRNKKKNDLFKDEFVHKTELTDRELEVIILLAKDQDSESIAKKLNVSVHTISTHRRNIKAKLGIATTAGIVAFGYENNIIVD